MDSGDEALKYLGLLDHDDLKPADSSSSTSSNPPQHSSAELEVRDSLTQLKISFEISNDRFKSYHRNISISAAWNNILLRKFPGKIIYLRLFGLTIYESKYEMGVMDDLSYVKCAQRSTEFE